jgi:hypothetical protein
MMIYENQSNGLLCCLGSSGEERKTKGTESVWILGFGNLWKKDTLSKDRKVARDEEQRAYQMLFAALMQREKASRRTMGLKKEREAERSSTQPKESFRGHGDAHSPRLPAT